MVGQKGLFSLVLIQFLFAHVLHLKCDICDLVLCRKFIYSHQPAELKAPTCHKLSTHHSIEHLMEVDEAIIDVDAHLKHSSIDIFIICKSREAHVFSHFTWKLHDEIRDFIRFHFHTLIKHREILPSVLKVLKVVLKSLQTVVFF